jgi:hypothetical protein
VGARYGLRSLAKRMQPSYYWLVSFDTKLLMLEYLQNLARISCVQLVRLTTLKAVILRRQRLGIGTTSPAYAFVVSAAGASGIEFGPAYSGTANLIQHYSRSGFVYVDAVNDAAQHRFQISGTERARIDSSGRLLVGTSSSASAGDSQYSRLQIRGNTSGSPQLGIISIQREEAASTITTNEGIGEIVFTDNAGNTFAAVVCEADANAGSGDYPGRLVFSTTADGASSPTERMRITSGGDFYFNCTVTTKTTEGFRVENDGQPSVSRGSAGSFMLFFHAGDGSTIGSITNSGGTATAYNTSSDYRLKENVNPVSDGITRLQQLKPSRFNFISDPDTVIDGFLAHEVQAVVPECVTGEKDAVDDDGNPVYQGIDQSKLVPLLTAALQEAIGEIKALKDRVTALETA